MKNLLQFFVFLIIILKTNGAEEVIYVHVGDKAELNLPNLPSSYYLSCFFERDDGLELAGISHLGRHHVCQDGIWNGKVSISPKQLTIKNIQEENFGIIVCRLSDSTNKLNSLNTFRLKKVNVSMNAPSPVIPGDQLSLKCDVDPEREPTIYWMSPNGQKNANGALKKTANNQDNGEWMCVVKDNGKENRFKFSVSVVDFSSASKHLYTSTNLPLNVPFLITPKKFVQQIPSKIKKVEWSFSPKTSFTRKTIFSVSLKNGQLDQGVQHGELHYENFTAGGNFSLYRNLAREEDRGSYNCSITFENGFTLTSTVVVEVLQIIPSPGSELISGYPLNLSCSTGGPLETDVEVKWFPPKTSSLANAELPQGHLVIPRVGTEDSGKWRCELRQNTMTLTSAVITLKIDPVLTVWMVVTICGSGVILILLLILAFILFRRRQRKVRHFRHRLCQCKNPKPKGFFKA